MRSSSGSPRRRRRAGEQVAAIGAGLVVLVGVERDDGEEAAARLAGKVARLRVFEDYAGRFDRSLLDVQGEALVVSQFTLIADTRKGNRPSFGHAAPPEDAAPLVERFSAELQALGFRFRPACSARGWRSRS